MLSALLYAFLSSLGACFLYAVFRPALIRRNLIDGAEEEPIHVFNDTFGLHILRLPAGFVYLADNSVFRNDAMDFLQASSPTLLPGCMKTASNAHIIEDGIVILHQTEPNGIMEVGHQALPKTCGVI